MTKQSPTNLIPLVDLRLQHEALKSELDQALSRVFTSSDFILGREVEAFETEFAAFCGVEHAVGCGNGTDALELALWAVGVKPGDEVITVSHTFAATGEAIVRCGAVPRFVDVNPDDLLMDLSRMEMAINPKTRAIVAVHLYGNCIDIKQIVSVARSRGIKVIEDAAQAHGGTIGGLRAGSLGDVGCFSFYPAKNLGACGDAGALVTSDSDLAGRVRQARDHGRQGKYEHAFIGRNSRMDAVQGAILRIKLRHLEKWNKRRRQIADRYCRQLALFPGLRLVNPPPDSEPSRHLFVVQIDERDAARQALLRSGISTGVHYPIPLHKQSAFTGLYQPTDASLPVTEAAASRVLSLPIFPEMTDEAVDRVAKSLAAAISKG